MVDRLVPRHQGVTVLIYHRVGGGSDSAVDLPVDEFSAQMAHLASNHSVLGLKDAINALKSADGCGAAVVVTFDDGTSDFAEHAVPVLVDHGIPATLYVATHFVDQQEAFPWDAPPATWSQLAEAVATGMVEVGSHSHRHLLFDRIDRAAAADEVNRSVELIGDHLGTTAAHFAYPKALAPSPETELTVRAAFRSAALAGSGVNRAGTDVHRLRRTPIQRGMTIERFEALCNGAGRLEGVVRERSAPWRYRQATS